MRQVLFNCSECDGPNAFSSCGFVMFCSPSFFSVPIVSYGCIVPFGASDGRSPFEECMFRYLILYCTNSLQLQLY